MTDSSAFDPAQQFVPIPQKMISRAEALVRERKQQDNTVNLNLLALEMRHLGASPASIKKAVEGFYEFLKHKGEVRLTKQDLNNIAGLLCAPFAIPESPGQLLSEVETQHINWLWPGRIPLGKITVLDGDPGMGKSLLAIDLAARVTTGQPMPDGSSGQQGSVVLIAPEDDASDTLKPRLEAAGGDPSQVLLLNTLESLDSKNIHIYNRPFTLPEDLDTLVKTVKTIGPMLVILDPLTAILSHSIDVSRDQAIRKIFAPLAHLAEHHGCAILIVRHLGKGGATNPLYRGAGSIGIIAIARTGLIVTHHPENQHQRILATSKNNLSKEASNLIYQVTENTHAIPYIQWLGESQFTPSALFNTSSRISVERQNIFRVLNDSNTALGPHEIAVRTGLDYVRVRKLVSRMCFEQKITSVNRGLYTTPHHPCLTTKSEAHSDVTTEQVSQVSQSSQSSQPSQSSQSEQVSQSH